MRFSPGRLSFIVGAGLIVGALVLVKAGPLKGDSALQEGGRGSSSGGRATSVRVAVLTTVRMADRIATVGTVLANEEVEVRSETNGRVEKILFSEGGRVAKGQVLVKMADAELRAQLARAESRLAIANDEAERQGQLFARDLTSESAHDAAANELNVAKAEVDLIRAQLAKTEIRAPFEGKVGMRFVSEGSYLSPATPITSLHDDTPVKIDFSVPERYAGRLKTSDKILFSVQGTPGRFEGTIYAIEPSIETATRTLRVRAQNPNEDGSLVPGAFADVEIIMKERDTITVPTYAVIPELEGHQVFVLTEGKAESRKVTIGTRTDDRIEVVRGLESGDSLITSGILDLKPGAPVTVSGIDSEDGGP